MRALHRSALTRALASLGLACALALGSAAAQERELDPRVFEIGRELRCPTCVSESVGESNAAIAREMRVLIQEQLDQGANRAEVLAFFQERYGDWILQNPPMRGVNLLVWLLPIVAVLVAVVVIARLLRRWRTAAERPIDVVDPSDLDRVRAELRGGLGDGAGR
jgi:cytochrome c-type biogenesis protein CcmH